MNMSSLPSTTLVYFCFLFVFLVCFPHANSLPTVFSGKKTEYII